MIYFLACVLHQNVGFMGAEVFADFVSVYFLGSHHNAWHKVWYLVTIDE